MEPHPRPSNGGGSNPGDPDVGQEVRGLIARRAPAGAGTVMNGEALGDDLPLASGGLGLDSIALVELLLDCEERFGTLGIEELLAGPPLTVGRLVARVRSGPGR